MTTIIAVIVIFASITGYQLSRRHGEGFMKLNGTTKCMSAAILFSMGNFNLSSAQSIESVITNIEANEQLYTNYELNLDTNYMLGKPDIVFDKTITYQRLHHRIIYQGPFFYWKQDGERQSEDKVKANLPILEGYDGEWTRHNEYNEFSNLRDDRSPDVRIFSPFTAAFWPEMGLSLSSFLRGGNYVSNNSSAGAYAKYDIRSEFVGKDKIGTLSCYKIKFILGSQNNTNKPSSFGFIWVSPERNYIPIKVEIYDKFFIGSPVSVTEISSFIEPKKGIWFPENIRRVNFERSSLVDGKNIIANSCEFNTKSIIFDVKYSKEFFSDIKLPDGKPLYKVIQGKPVEKYLLNDNTNTSRRSTLFYIITINVCLVSCFFLYYVIRRWKLNRS